MHAYHGATRHFDCFDLSFLGSGEGANLLAIGINLATNPAVADFYRDRLVVPGSDFSDVLIHAETGVLLGSDAEKASEALQVFNNADKGSLQWRKASMALEVFGLTGKEVPAYGAVYDVIVPDRDAYLVWEGGVDEQPFDMADLVRELYNEDALDEIYEEAMEECPLGCSQDHFDKVFEKALIQGVRGTLDELNDIAPGFNWDQLEKVIGERCPGIIVDENEEAGRALYGSLRHLLGSEEAAAHWLTERGIKGLITSQEFTGFDGPCEIIVVWSPVDAKIDHIMSPDEIHNVAVRLEQESEKSRVLSRGGWQSPSL